MDTNKDKTHESAEIKEKVIISKNENDDLLVVEEYKKKPKFTKLMDLIGEEGVLSPEVKLLTVKLDAGAKETNLYKIFMESFSSQYGLKSYLYDRVSVDRLKDFLSKSKNLYAVNKDDLAKVGSGEIILKTQYESLKVSDDFSVNKIPGTKQNEVYSLSFADEDTGLFNQLQFKDAAAFKSALINNDLLRRTLESPTTNWMLIKIDEQELNNIKMNSTDLKVQHENIVDKGTIVAFKVGETTHSISVSHARVLGQAFSEKDIDWKQFEAMGISKSAMTEMDINNLLNGKKTGIIPFSIMKGEVKQLGEAKFRLAYEPSGQPTLVVHGVRKSLNIPNEIAGYKVSENDKRLLQEYGTTFSKVDLTTNGKKYSAYLGVDKETNEVVVLPANKIRINETLKGVKLTHEQQNSLQEGKPVFIENMIGVKGQFSAFVAIDPAKSTLQFFKDEPKIQIEEKQEIKTKKKRGMSI